MHEYEARVKFLNCNRKEVFYIDLVGFETKNLISKTFFSNNMYWFVNVFIFRLPIYSLLPS